MNTKNKKVLSIMIVAIMLVITVTATYAFFAANITGTDVSTSVYFATANQGITITFEGGEAETLTNIYPRESAWLEKDITIKSTAIASDITSIYTFNIVVEENDFHANDIKYTFTNKKATGVEPGYTETGDLTNLESKIDIAHGYVKGTNASEITYTLSVYFVNENDRNQNTGSALTARFYITYNWSNTVNLTVNLDGGEGLSNMSVTANSSITLPEPTKPGYIFTGWEVNGATIEGNQLTMGTTDATITATWEEEILEPLNFATDSWATVIKAVREAKTNGTVYPYTVGAERNIDLGDLGKHTVRIADTRECTDSAITSETTCGFVLEFKNIIQNYSFNDPATNIGGWASSQINDYLNSTVLSAFPDEIAETIIKTKVISSRGPNDTSNHASEDYLYLLSPEEIYGTSFSEEYDTSIGTSRQLEYYLDQGVTLTNYAGAKKNLGNYSDDWWLRSASTNTDSYFYNVEVTGLAKHYFYAANKFGISPAFRIG